MQEYLISSHNYVAVPPSGGFLDTSYSLGKEAKKTGFDGVALSPGWIEVVRPHPNGVPYVGAGLQGFRDTPKEGDKHPRKVLAAGAMFVYPHMNTTLRTLKHYQEKNKVNTGRTIPIALQNLDQGKVANGMGLANRCLILNPEFAEELQITNLEELPDKLQERDFDGIVLDPLYQYRRKEGVLNTETAVKKTWKSAGLVVLSFGRDDIGAKPDHPVAQFEMNRFLDYGEYSKIGSIIKGIRTQRDKTGHMPPVVIQVPFTAVSEHYRNMTPIPSRAQVRELQQKLLINTRKILEGK